jgi:hypothetical protein
MESLNDLKDLPKNGGLYIWTMPNQDGVLEPYYIGQTSDFEKRFTEEFSLFLGGRWFCFDPDTLKSYTRLALALDGRDLEDPQLFEQTGFLAINHEMEKSVFCHFASEERIKIALKMIRRTQWVLLSAKDKHPNSDYRKIEDQMIMNYRAMMVREKTKINCSQNATVPHLISRKTGQKKHFIGDWNGNRQLAIKKPFRILNSEELNKKSKEVIREIVKA